MIYNFKRAGTILPFIAVIIALLLILFTSWYMIRIPSDGMEWSRIDGIVYSIHPLSSVEDLIKPGDVLLTIDGLPSSQSASIYATKRPGDTIRLTVLREDEILTRELQLSKPSGSELANRLAPTLIAFAFWLIGFIVEAFTPPLTTTNLFFGLCMFGSGILASGSVSARGPEWTSNLFNLLLWWIGPVAVHLHILFPEPRRKLLRWKFHVILYSIAALGSMPFLLIGSGQLHASQLNRTIYAAGRSFITLNLIIVIILLIFTYIHSTSGRTRQQIRIITLYSVISFLMVITFTILPGLLFLGPMMPYEVGLLFLLPIPISYSYAIIRYRLIKLEKFLNRGAAYVLVFTLLIGFYFGILALIERLLPASIHEDAFTSLVAILPLVITYEPLRRRLQTLVDWVFYGGWYDYRSATSKITEGFGQFTNTALLGETITNRVKETLRAEYAYLLRINSEGLIFPIPETGELAEKIYEIICRKNQIHLPKDGILYQYLLSQPDVLDSGVLSRVLSEEALLKEEQDLLSLLRGNLLTPILGNDILLGLLVLGPKNGREVYSSEDYDILAVVSRHAGIALQNIQLLNELRHRATEIDQLHQEILRAREEERKMLSLEIHDEIIQSLVGLNFDIAQIDSEKTPQLREEVRQVVSDLRRICSELRPPTLDNLGLVSAIRSRLRELEKTSRDSLHIELSVDGNEEQAIPEDVALSLYRVLSEALTNTQKHASAEHVSVHINIQPDRIDLEVKDNGHGFNIPRPLGKLLSEQHFGLVGMRERIEHIHGNLMIESSLDKGTRIIASIPLGEFQQTNNKDLYSHDNPYRSFNEFGIS
jgi:two-component system sensor histidine kinase ComP